MIFGYSGSGKSTLAQLISKEYNLPILYIDKILYDANWKKRDDNASLNDIKSFLIHNKNWIVDGNGISKMFYERAELADKIIFMDLGPIQCYKNAKERYKKYKNLPRESRPDGCPEKFDLSFKMWILFNGRKKKRRQSFSNLVENYKHKVIFIKNKKDISYLLDNLDVLLLK